MTPDMQAQDSVLEDIVKMMNELEDKNLKGSVTIEKPEVDPEEKDETPEEMQAEGASDTEPSDAEDAAALRKLAFGRSA
jgi:hypothetical protein